MKLDNNAPIAILGDRNTGKTNLAVYLARETGRKAYLLGYPKDIPGFTRISSLDDLGLIKECVLVVDEFTRYFPIWERKTNGQFIEFLRFTAHNDIKLILTDQLSQAITKQVEAFIGQWAIKRIRMGTLKNGSTPKNILKYYIKHPNITSEFVKLEPNEYVWWNELASVGENGIRSFPFQDIGKDWKNNASDETETIFGGKKYGF